MASAIAAPPFHTLAPAPARRLLRGMRVVAVALLLLGIASPSLAADPDDRAKKLEAKKAEWVRKHQELVTRHEQVRADLQRAREDYSRGRSTLHLRGEGKAALVEEIDRLEKEFAEVDQKLKDFPDEARRAGAFPGWFRDDDPAPPAEARPDPRVSRRIGAREDGGDDSGADAVASDERDGGGLSDRRSERRERRRLP